MSDQPSSLPALHRGIAVLELVARQRSSVSFSQISEVLGGELPASTVSRLLAALIEGGLLRQDADRLYQSGTRLQALGRSLSASVDLADLAQPLLRVLAEECGESAACFRKRGRAAELVAKHECEERFGYMGIGGVNSKAEHGFNRLLQWREGRPPPVLVNKQDDQPGLARIVALASPQVVVGISCLAAGLNKQRTRELSQAVEHCARQLAQQLEQS